MNSSEAAAWVQALGSVLAIIAAIYVSAKQFKDATELQRRAIRDERDRKHEALLGLIDAALADFTDTLNALRGSEPLKWFEEKSTRELMEEFYQAFAQISPLDMPSATAARALVTLRDRIKTAAWNAKTAIDDHTPCNYKEYTDCVVAMEDNLNEVRAERVNLVAEMARVQT